MKAVVVCEATDELSTPAVALFVGTDGACWYPQGATQLIFPLLPVCPLRAHPPTRPGSAGQVLDDAGRTHHNTATVPAPDAAASPSRASPGFILSATATSPALAPTPAPAPPEVLFVRLLAEVLRWLEAPPASGSAQPAGNAAAAAAVTAAVAAGSGGAPPLGPAPPGGWAAWLALQRSRLASQMELLAAAAASDGGEPSYTVGRVLLDAQGRTVGYPPAARVCACPLPVPPMHLPPGPHVPLATPCHPRCPQQAHPRQSDSGGSVGPSFLLTQPDLV